MLPTSVKVWVAEEMQQAGACERGRSSAVGVFLAGAPAVPFHLR